MGVHPVSNPWRNPMQSVWASFARSDTSELQRNAKSQEISDSIYFRTSSKRLTNVIHRFHRHSSIESYIVLQSYLQPIVNVEPVTADLMPWRHQPYQRVPHAWRNADPKASRASGIVSISPAGEWARLSSMTWHGSSQYVPCENTLIPRNSWILLFS